MVDPDKPVIDPDPETDIPDDDNVMQLHFTTTKDEQEISLEDCFYRGIPPKIEKSATIYWGDESDPLSVTAGDVFGAEEFRHTYSTAGDKVITITGDVYWGGYTGYVEILDVRKLLTSITIPKGKKSPIYNLQHNGFNSATKLETIPENLFERCNNVTSFSSCFMYCESLKLIPSKLFENCTSVTTFLDCFWGCHSLTAIPGGLFDNCINVESFANCFQDCLNLTSLPHLLFSKCRQATDFHSCFSGCSNLQELPKTLFYDCRGAIKLDFCFSNCVNLISIPKELFMNSYDIESFNGCFRVCSNLASIPDDLFLHNTRVKDFSTCFEYCRNVTSKVPRLWESNPDADGNDCFYECTKAENFKDIPFEWR